MSAPTGRRALRALLATAAIALGAVAPAAPAMAGAKKAAKGACDPVAGWTAVANRPADLQPLGATGLYIWNEHGLWRVAATHGDRRVEVFQGTISFDAPITATPVGVEGRFDVVQPNKQSASFTFKNYGGIDGIAITAPCATTVSVTGTLDGQPLDVSQVFLGSTAANPTAVPATVQKGVTPATTPPTVPPSTAAPATTAPAANAAASVTTPGVVSACPTTTWPAGTAGRPVGLRPRNASGLYAWSERSGWSVVVSGDPGKPQRFTGKVTVIAPAASGSVVVQPIGLEGATDAVRVVGNTVEFDVLTGNAIDGFQLFAPCATQITIEASVDGVAMLPSQMFVGSSAAPVNAVPYTVSR